MKKSLLLGALCIAAPVALLLPGCSGGTASLVSIFPTPTPSGTAAPTPRGTVTPTPHGTATPTPRGTPTSTPLPSGVYNLVPNLTFSAVTAGSSINSAPLTSLNDLSSGGNLDNSTVNGAAAQTTSLGGSSTNSGPIRRLLINVAAFPDIFHPGVFSVGQLIPLGAPPVFGSTSRLIQIIQVGNSGLPEVWRASSGNVKVTALGSNSITLQFLSVRFDPAGTPPGTGSFTLNGTVKATGLTVVN